MMREAHGILPAEGDVMLRPHSALHLSFRGQTEFLPMQLCIPHDVAHKLKVSGISCGSLCLFAGSGELPGEVFCEKRRGKMVLELDWKPLKISESVRVSLTSSLDHSLEVRAFLKGRTRFEVAPTKWTGPGPANGWEWGRY